MRIGYLYDMRIFPPKGGNHVHAMELLSGFLEEGNKVFVVDDPSAPGATNFESDSDALQRFVYGIDVLYVRIDARSTRRWSALNQCVSLLAGRVPVVWEINSPANETLAYSWLGGEPDPPAGFPRIVRRMRRWAHAIRKMPEIFTEERHRRMLSKSVDAAIVVSESLRSYAGGDLGITQVHVLPNGGPLLTETEIESRASRRTESRFTVFYSGSSIYPWQGLNYIERTIEIASSIAPDIVFVLAVNQLPTNMRNKTNVTMLEHLDREQILDATCASDVCLSVHPRYPWSKYGFHNSPMKLFEYMACMRPVVVSDHGQMSELIDDGINGLRTNNDPEDILRKLIYLKNNPQTARSMARHGWECVQRKYNWPYNVKLTLSVFRDLIAATREHHVVLESSSRQGIE